MQFKLAAFTTIAAMATLAAATPARRNDGSGPSNQCNTGSLQCCQSVQDSKSLDSTALGLLNLLGVVVSTLTADVGLTCSPISAVGVGGTSCSEQPVCCTDNSFKGVVALGCTPINVNL